MPPLAAPPRTPAATMPPGPSVRGTPLAAKGMDEPAAVAAAKAMGADGPGMAPQAPKGPEKAPIHALAMSMENDLQPPLEEKKEVSAAPPAAAAAPAAYAAANVFDQAMLGDLRKSIAGPQFDDLIRGLFDKTDEIVDALAAAAANGDQKAMTQRAHELKGMAANFGLKELSGVAAEAEKALKENRTEGIGNLLSTLPAANQRAKEALQTWMKAS
jgi:HPt (histidine-containing phosphotransfer) domain-containing protein